MSEVTVPRFMLAVALIIIAAAAIAGVYYYYQKSVREASATRALDTFKTVIESAQASGSSSSEPLSLRGASVSVVNEEHVLEIYYNLSQTLPPLPGLGNVTPTLYAATVEYQLLVLDMPTEVPGYSDNQVIVGVASEDEGFGGIDPIILTYSNGTRIVFAPRIIILYKLDEPSRNLTLTVYTPKINLSCSGGSCSKLNGQYVVRVNVKTVDILPQPYTVYNPLAEGKFVEASFTAGNSTLLPASYFGKAPIATVDYDYNISIDLKYIYYEIYLERVG